MSDIIRYDIETLDETACDHYMGASQQGDYVLFTDHLAELATLRQQLAEANAVVEKLMRLTASACDQAHANDATQGWHYLTSLYDDMKNTLSAKEATNG